MLCDRYIQWQNFCIKDHWTIQFLDREVYVLNFFPHGKLLPFSQQQFAALVDLRSSLQDDASGIRRRHGGSAMIATKHSDKTTTVPLCLGGNHGSMCFDMKCFHGSHVVLVSILQPTQNSSILCLTCALSITPPPDGGLEVWGGSVHAWSLPLSGHAQGLEGVGAWGELLEIGRSSAVFHGSRNRSGNHPCKLKNGMQHSFEINGLGFKFQHSGTTSWLISITTPRSPISVWPKSLLVALQYVAFLFTPICSTHNPKKLYRGQPVAR